VGHSVAPLDMLSTKTAPHLYLCAAPCVLLGGVEVELGFASKALALHLCEHLACKDVAAEHHDRLAANCAWYVDGLALHSIHAKATKRMPALHSDLSFQDRLGAV